MGHGPPQLISQIAHGPRGQSFHPLCHPLRYSLFMAVHRSQVISNKTLVLDGSQFIDCTLIRCTLKYNGGIVILKGTSVSNCTWQFGGQALNTVELLKTLGALRSGITESWGITTEAGRHGL